MGFGPFGTQEGLRCNSRKGVGIRVFGDLGVRGFPGESVNTISFYGFISELRRAPALYLYLLPFTNSVILNDSSLCSKKRRRPWLTKWWQSSQLYAGINASLAHRAASSAPANQLVFPTVLSAIWI
ncbi:uncharacterized protein LOC100257652 [Vitis vinifera]|uniref:uncharacterized protein LOC100257652 n=1 Tax=Vitis vinifera TaxID=29760 RepID=UPI0028830494|nr:uncharacterized protein LOC100257652 [Vitis vinifera]